MTGIRVHGLTLGEAIAGAPKRRATFVRPDRLEKAVYDRHAKWGAGWPLHEYDGTGRCTVLGCPVFDPSEGDELGGDSA